MRVLSVTPFYPPDPGGISIYVWKLNQALSKKVEILTVTCRVKRLPRMRNTSGVLCFHPPSFPYGSLKSFRIPFNFSAFGAVMDDFNPHIVHLHGHHYPSTWVSLLEAKRRMLPTVLTMHGLYALDPSKPYGITALEEVFNKVLASRIFKNADLVVGLTNSMVKYAQRYGANPDSCVVIPSGVDLQVYRRLVGNEYEFRAKLGLPMDKIIVLFVGRFEPVKGLTEVARSVKEIAECRGDVFFLFVGRGSLEKLLSRLSSSGCVRVEGWKPHRLLPFYYVASDILLLPSRWEALPLSLLEAMASGIHIVATPVGGIPELLENYPCKTYIKGFASEHIKAALFKAFTVVKGMDKRKRCKVSLLNWDQVAERYLMVFRKLLATN